MRILTKRLYRAFPELDRFSDIQCGLLMRRVHLDVAARFIVRAAPLLASGVALLLVVVLLVVTEILVPAQKLFRDADILFGLLASLGLAALAGLLARDLLLRRFLIKAIRLRIDRVRCLSCRYILIGQRPDGDAVSCPECGTTNYLHALGITAADLIPPASELDWLSSQEVADRQNARRR